MYINTNDYYYNYEHWTCFKDNAAETSDHPKYKSIVCRHTLILPWISHKMTQTHARAHSHTHTHTHSAHRYTSSREMYAEGRFIAR